MEYYYDSIMYVLRIFGRFGFVFFLITLWRLWDFFASPSLKKRSRIFVKFFIITTIVSFLLLASEYLFSTGVPGLITTLFNVITIYILTFYLNKQLSMFKKAYHSTQFIIYTKAMDDLIDSMNQSYDEVN